MREKWLPVPGFPKYRVSDQGRVQGPRGVFLKHCSHPSGYPRVTLRRDGESKTVSVHLIVARTFLGPTPPGKEVNHRDSNRENPKLRNLEWMTRRENAIHGIIARRRREMRSNLTRSNLCGISASSQNEGAR
jgi:hypothetical protein